MKMRAAIFVEPKRPLVLDEVELDAPAEGEALVRLVATGVCHTDFYTMSGLDPSALWPAILGHEGGGVVEAVHGHLDFCPVHRGAGDRPGQDP
ncbi:MAG: alcohol dehydrogenase catalytic domain-containing protein [Deltaproteobacteria bacterium]|nr:alcohol dehydrogenase catalytic domain-containing protein [Deltaproteobacteria bacterium]